LDGSKERAAEKENAQAKMNRKLLLLSACFCIGIVSVLLYTFAIITGVQTMEMSLQIGTSYGFNLETDKLYFARTPPGGEVRRTFTIQSNRPYPLLVRIQKKGDIGPWVALSNASVTLSPFGKAAVQATAYPPPYAHLGNYSGYLRIISSRALW